MAISKIILNGVTQMDVTQDTVAAANLLSGHTAHGADGESITGTYEPTSQSNPTATFEATAASTDATISFEAGDYAIPSQYALFVKSDVTSSNGANFCISGGFHTKQNTVPTMNIGLTQLGRYFGYKASSGTDYYGTGNSSQNYLTKSGTTLVLKFNNNHKFKAGGTYTIQIIELDDTFFDR